MSRQEVIRPDEVYLASRDPATGALRREVRLPLARGTRVGETLQGLNPPVLAIGEQGRDTQPFASSITFEDLTGGIGLYSPEVHEPEAAINRAWWATADLRRPRQVTLLKKKTDRGVPSGIVAADDQPRAGGVFGDRVWVAWDQKVRSYTESGGWTNGTYAGDRTLTGSAVPTNNPTEWEGGWFWPLGTNGIDVWNGTTWWNIASATVGVVVHASTLYLVSAAGAVKKVTAATATAKIANATLAAGDLTTVVSVSDTCSGMLLFTTADAEDDIVPYVIGQRGLYQIDPATNAAQPAGPLLPPARFPIRAAVGGGDGSLYVAQGMTVVAWDGQTANPRAGLDADDGVPVEQRGGISALLPIGQSLFALVDATRAAGSGTLDIYGTGPAEVGVLDNATGRSWLASREADGWVVRAVSEADSQAPTLLFVSTAESTYRVWFAWDATCYSIDLEQGLFNPLDDPTGQYEASGSLTYPAVDFGYHEHEKVGLVVDFRTRNCSATSTVKPYVQYDQNGTWYELYAEDGTTHTVTTNGRHTRLLHANPVPTAGVWADDPAAGHSFDHIQVRLDLARGSTDTETPAVSFLSIHARKTQPALLGWEMTVDFPAAGYNGLSAWRMRTTLLALIADSEDGLLHFAYLPDGETAGTAEVRAVGVMRAGGLGTSGLAVDYVGQMHLAISEVRSG